MLNNANHYYDHNATTPVAHEIIQALPDLFQHWGNPSSIHMAGRVPKNILRETRQKIAQYLNCSPLEIVFNSGGSEGNNTIIKSVFQILNNRKNHFMCSQVEHPSVIKTMQYLESHGAKVDYIPVNRKGEIDFDFYEKHLTNQTALVSVMTANNETGTIFPIQKIVELAHLRGALFHTDAVQIFGKASIDLKSLNIDYATFSAHKFYSLKGTGFIYLKKGAPFESLIIGGGQERQRRGGTENTVGIAALGQVLSRLDHLKTEVTRITELRDYFEKKVLQLIANVTVTAGESERIGNTSSLVIPGVDGETLLMNLDLKGYAVSTGAACSSGNPEPSPVLLAMGLTRAEAQNSLRVSFGWGNQISEVDQFIQVLVEIVHRLRRLQQEEIYDSK